jgi:restriction system protein
MRGNRGVPMAVPYAEDLMLPLLRYAGDGREHSFHDAIEMLASEHRVSEADRALLRPDGRTRVFDNRVGWARMYLYKAGLLSSARRGFFQITERGRGVLRDPPARITQRFLLQYPEYAAFRTGSKSQESSQPTTKPTLAPTGSRGLSFADAAERVLQQYGNRQPMHYQAITDKAIELGLIRTQGQTPEATLRARLATETQAKIRRGESPRFTLHGKGLFGLTNWHDAGLGYRIEQHNTVVRRQLLAQLGRMPPAEFEGLTRRLLEALGFQDVEVTSPSGDGGIDVRGTLVVGEVIRTRMAVQVKRWKNNVHAPIVQQVRGSLGTHDQGLIITTSDFSAGARIEAERANAVPVALMNGEQLVRLLVEHNIGIRRVPYDLIELGESEDD